MKKYKYLSTLFVIIAMVMAGCEPQGFEAPSDGKVSAISVEGAVYVSTGTPSMQISLKDNEELQLKVVILPNDAKNTNVNFANKHPELLEVTSAGLLKPKAFGKDTLTISATDGSGVSTRYIVNIIDHDVKATGFTVGESGRNMLLRPDETFNLAAQVSLVPADTWNKAVAYKSDDETVATVSSAGVVTAVSVGKTVIKITTADGTNITTECNVTVEEAQPIDIVRTGWKVVDISHSRPTDAVIVNAEDSHIDGNTATSLSLVKPGRTSDGISPGLDEVIYFTLDLGKEEEFDYVRIVHRNKTIVLRVYEFTLLGSNDNINFTDIATNVAVPNATNSESPDSGNIQVPLSSYRYVKFVYTAWDTNPPSGNTMQIAEFYLGIVK